MSNGPTLRFPLVFVLGVARSGSTLLGRLLDSHPEVLTLGEFMRLDRALRHGRPCSCGSRVERCDFWGPRLGWIEAETGNDFRRFTPDFYARVARSSGARVACDLSKTMTLKLTRGWRDRGEGYVFLVRDSRGILASAARRGKNVERLLNKHRRWMNRLYRFVQRREGRSLILRYEELCRRPEQELRRVCEFIGIAFDAVMLRPADAPHHLVHVSDTPYLAGRNEISLDERWRTELAPDLLGRIEAQMQSIEVFRAAQASSGWTRDP
jgi:hypothetical protein